MEICGYNMKKEQHYHAGSLQAFAIPCADLPADATRIRFPFMVQHSPSHLEKRVQAKIIIRHFETIEAILHAKGLTLDVLVRKVAYILLDSLV